MIEITQTTDLDYIKEVMYNEAVIDSIGDDVYNIKTLPDKDINPLSIPGFFLKVTVDSIPAGWYWLIWHDNLVEAHTALLPVCRGRLAVDATKKAIKWVFGNTKANAITSFSWSDSPHVEWLCRKAGLTKTSTEKWPNTRFGKEVMIHRYSITREDLE